MKIKQLKLFTYIYLILPIIIFIMGWVKIQIAIIASTLLIVIVIKKIIQREETTIFISKTNIAIIFILITLICITAGQGGLFYQSNDWNWRNAIFRDLINYDWPVYYEQMDANLVYYIGIWMVPAIIGKIMVYVFGNVIAWKMANVVLLIWCSIGVTLGILWIIKILNIKKISRILIVILIFLGFSGLDIVGILITNNTDLLREIHLEWWAIDYQFSSMITQLFWVFNQCIIPWLITIIVIDEKKVENYLLLILLCLPYGPLPFLGMIPIMGIRGIKYLITAIKNKKFKNFLKDVFSIENMLGLIAILPIYYFYYRNNAATSTGNFRIETAFLNFDGMKKLIIFWFLEIGIYGLLLFKENNKNELFLTSIIALLFIPLFKIGLSADFAMRASIPAIVCVVFYLIKYVIDNLENKKINFKTIIVIIVFLIGFSTPFYEYKRAITFISLTKKVDLVADGIRTFSNKDPEDYQNFICVSPKQTSIFFKYISK